jgi:DNA polymerase I-like protein with 3'-5' exonuclease and polymerase domains
MIQKSYVTVTTKDAYIQMMHHIVENDIIAIDTETSGLNPRRDAIIGFSVSGKEGVGFYMPTIIWKDFDTVEATIEGKSAHELAKFALNKLKGKKLIAHNFSFDGKFIKNYYGIDLIEDLYCDTILLAHTLDEEGPGFFYGKPFGLKEIAMAIQKELGLDIQNAANEEQLRLKESIKKNGGSITKDSYEIWKADLPILSEYAAADTDLTLRIYNYYIKKLKEENLEKFFFEDEVMPLYKEVTIKMEEHGVRLDMPLVEKSREDITKDMQKYANLVMKELMENNKVKKWIIETARKKYPPTNKGTFAQIVAEKANLQLPRSEKTGKYSITYDNLLALEDSVYRTFLHEGDPSILDDKFISSVCLHLWKENNDGVYFNIQSKDQIGEIAFDALGYEPISLTPKGKPQFDDDIIQKIAETESWAKNLRIYNRLLKIKSTYIDRFYEGQENGRYYAYYKQHATVSGRYGSDMQQLPRPKEEGDDEPIVIQYTNLVRAFFIPDENSMFVDCDYESLEPHTFAHISGDDGLKDIFRNNWDFYSTIAIKTEKLDQYSPDKKADNYLRKLAPAIRNKAKAYALGIPYGMGAYALGKTINVSTKEAKELIEGYLGGFPELRKWMQNSEKQAKELGYVSTQVGRVRHLPKVKKIHDNIGDAILDYKTKKQLEYEFGVDEVKKVSRDYINGLNNAKNVQIQGLAASIVNRAAIAINRELISRGIKGQVIAQIHDQLVIEAEKDKIEEVAMIVQDKMENTTKISIALKAPPAIAINLRDGH